MITRQQREEIRRCITDAAESVGSVPTCVFGGGRKFSLHDVPRLLDDLDKAEEENERLRVLVGKLHKVVNLASLTNCDHKCFTKETKNHLLTLLEESRTVVEHGKVG